MATNDPNFFGREDATPSSGFTTYCLAPEPLRASFVPQPDITAYELATILPFFLGGRMLTEADWGALGAAQRHLVRE